MKCKDFLWEYDLMKEIVSRQRSVNHEQHSKVSGSELKVIEGGFDKAVRESVEACRQSPEEKYWRGVLAPALQKQLQR